MGWRVCFFGRGLSLWVIVDFGGRDGWVNLELAKVCGGGSGWYMYGVGLFDVYMLVAGDEPVGCG